jgi:hypothetical protein
MVIYIFYVTNLLYDIFINAANFAVHVIYAPRITISVKAVNPDTVTNECVMYDGWQYTFRGATLRVRSHYSPTFAFITYVVKIWVREMSHIVSEALEIVHSM